MFKITFCVEGHMASTLSVEQVCENHDDVTTGMFSRTHLDGWTISGHVNEDWYCWVNDFEASHPTFGRVWGNFESKVFADTAEGFAAFYEAHPPESWDYWDI